MSAPDWLPNVFILGVPKAGTTSLHNWIAAHPDALGARSKEARFFVDPESHVFRPDFHIGQGLARYREEFAHGAGRPARVVLDSTPAYLYQRAAFDHVPALPTAPRCLVILREPADQIHSLYRYFRDNWGHVPADMSFAGFVAACRHGSHEFAGNELARHALRNARYADILRPWRARLGDERLLVRSFDDLRADPRAFTVSVARWMGLDPAFYDDFDFPRENLTLAPRIRWLQRANIALRAHLPKGAPYRLARALYHRLNLRRQPVKTEEAEVMDRLRAEFAEANAALAREYGLDLSRWPMPRDQPVRTSS